MNKNLVWFYQHNPIFMQNFIISIARVNRYRERYFSSFYKKYLTSLMQSQWYSQKELEILQNKKLRAIIQHAYDSVPYYHKVFRSKNLHPEDIKTRRDLEKLPIIDKEVVRKNWNEFISRKYNRWQIVKTSTAGSTGSALKIVWNKKSIMIEHCFEARHWDWAGVNSRDKLAHFGSVDILVSESQNIPPFWRISIPERMVYFSPAHLSEKNLSFYINKLQQFNPKIIRGHPSKIYIVARYMEEKGFNGIYPKAIFTSSEMLLPYQRTTIEKLFHCKIFDIYGNNEHVSLITQCEKGDYHINSEYGIIEFPKDDGTVINDETSEMVCTGFTNYAMPLIRYKIEDLAIPTDEICDCNRKFPLVRSIQGRTRDIIVTKDGRYLTTGAIVEGIDKIGSIKEWQVVQKSKEYYIINFTINQSCYSDNDVSRLREMVRRRVGEGEIEINIVDHIVRPKNKFRAVISDVKF